MALILKFPVVVVFDGAEMGSKGVPASRVAKLSKNPARSKLSENLGRIQDTALISGRTGISYL